MSKNKVDNLNKGVDDMWVNNLEKLNFKMDDIKLFDSFAGKGALHKSLKKLGVPTKVVGLSEVEPDAIIAYAGVHIEGFKDIEFEYLEDKEMREELMSINVGWDFTKQKSSIPRMKKEKLKILYKANKLTNNYGDISKLDYDKLPSFDLFNFSFPCFVEGTLVLTDKGYKNIEDIDENDNVLTHTNEYRKVVKPMKQLANHIYRLKTMASEDLMVTEEHPFYVRKRYREWDNSVRKSIRKFNNPEWIKVKDLSKDYYVGIAINQKSKTPDWDGCIVNSPYAKRGNVKKLNNIKNYFNNDDFWWVVGRYMGDGWVKNSIDYKGTDIYDLYICCAKDELHEITDVLDRLNLINEDFKYKYYDSRTTYKIRISNVEFAKFLQQFGKYAHNKHITESILDLPVNLLKMFLEGYMSADGCYTQDRHKCSTVSKKLIYGLGQCIAKTYNVPYSIYKSKRKKQSKIEGRIVNQRTQYQCCYKLNKGKQDKAFYDNGYLWCPINNVEIEEYYGYVYNMEVSEDNSYTVNNIIVHNCTDISTAGKQKGLTNDDGTHTRSGLVKFGIDLIKAKTPKYIMIENVKGLIQNKFINDFYGIVNDIEVCGYKCYYATKEKNKVGLVPICLNAKNYGIPQNRERIFVICVRNDCNDSIVEFPKGFDNGIRLKDLLESEVDEKYYLSEEIQKRFKHNGKDDIDRNELNVIGSSAPECRTIGQRDITYGVQGVMSTLTATDYKQPKQILDKKVGMVNSNYEIKPRYNGVTNCIDTGIGRFPDNHGSRTGVLEYDDIDFRIRKLTPKECWRLMGFDDIDFDNAKELGLADSSLYKLAGNSIVVNVLYYIFKELFKEYIVE